MSRLKRWAIAVVVVLSGGMGVAEAAALQLPLPADNSSGARSSAGTRDADESTWQISAMDPRAIALFSEDLDIAAETSGVVNRLAVKEGDLVSGGDVLAVLDDRRAKLEHQLAKVQWELAEQRADDQVNLEFAQLSEGFAKENLRRVQEAEDSIADSEREQFQFEAMRGRLAVRQAERDQRLALLEAKTAEAQWNLTAHDLQRHQVVAPIEGVVVEWYQRPGEFLQAGQPLVRMVRNDVMRVSGAVELDQIDRVKRGDRARFQTADGRSYLGTVIFVSPETFGEIDQVKVIAEVQVPERDLKAKVVGALQILKQVER